MDIQVCIRRYRAHAGTDYIRTSFTEADLLEWAKQYIENQYSDSEAVDVDVEAIIP